jgi:hypothetical protein
MGSDEVGQTSVQGLPPSDALRPPLNAAANPQFTLSRICPINYSLKGPDPHETTMATFTTIDGLRCKRASGACPMERSAAGT